MIKGWDVLEPKIELPGPLRILAKERGRVATERKSKGEGILGIDVPGPRGNVIRQE
jgi:hypothetical protein